MCDQPGEWLSAEDMYASYMEFAVDNGILNFINAKTLGKVLKHLHNHPDYR